MREGRQRCEGRAQHLGRGEEDFLFLIREEEKMMMIAPYSRAL